MELHEYLSIALTRWRVVVAAGLLGGALAGGISLLLGPTYVARTRLLFSVSVAGDPRELNRGANYTQALVSSYAELTDQPVVLNPVIGRLGLDTTPGRLAQDVTASSPEGTTIIDISAADPSARRSAEIADAVAAELARVVPALAAQNGGTTVPTQVTILSPASVPVFKSAPRTKVNAVLGVAAGTVLGLGLAVLVHRIDVRISDSEAARATGAPVLGTLRRRRPAAGPLGQRRPDRSGDVEQLRTALQNLRLNSGYRTVMLTSPVDAELSSGVALELGESLSRAGTRVLVVDADLQHPELTRAAGHLDEPGLSNVLSRGLPWQLAVFEHGSPPVTVLGAGPPPWSPDLLLESASTESALRRAARQFDIVLVSAPPVLQLADTLLLSRITDGTVLVVDRRRTTRDDLAEGFARLDVVGARVLGVVLRD